MKKPIAIRLPYNLAHAGLLVFLAILLLQSAVGLFVPAVEGTESIDIVLRTTLGSVYGYLMTAIWQQTGGKGRGTKGVPPPRTIGFVGERDVPKNLREMGDSPPAEVAPPPSIRMEKNPSIQIGALLLVGLFCMLTLIYVRFFGSANHGSSATVATVTQYRDMISGVVGALIGLVRHQDEGLQSRGKSDIM